MHVHDFGKYGMTFSISAFVSGECLNLTLGSTKVPHLCSLTGSSFSAMGVTSTRPFIMVRHPQRRKRLSVHTLCYYATGEDCSVRLCRSHCPANVGSRGIPVGDAFCREGRWKVWLHRAGWQDRDSTAVRRGCRVCRGARGGPSRPQVGLHRSHGESIYFGAVRPSVERQGGGRGRRKRWDL